MKPPPEPLCGFPRVHGALSRFTGGSVRAAGETFAAGRRGRHRPLLGVAALGRVRLTGSGHLIEPKITEKQV
ncbi:hypothetical protein CtesDRAFT_PD0837 [Comamonas testosteroni KF-1]|uniref:Uncharacterized protein n=1 Tax=Comamonas testosteroni (strain DSM 14576 / KF-1) TaxID=399795 RepID=B7WWI8_COMTK|nr:hypothetical protein CtesDRAFT_PD0837 [Comamonas testosteroni KF-1]